jgi:hypothetical protein
MRKQAKIDYVDHNFVEGRISDALLGAEIG